MTASLRESRLSLHDRSVGTPFGLLGEDENALTFALGYTFAESPRLLQAFLSRAGIQGLWARKLARAKIYLQRHRADGITDIEIVLPEELHVIVEAKVGMSVPQWGQLRRYHARLTASTARRKKLIALVEAPTDLVPTASDRFRRRRSFVTPLPWALLVTLCAGLRGASVDAREQTWLQFFQEFLEWEFGMKCHTDEVWIVPVNTQPLWPGGLSFLDTHEKASCLM